MGASSEKTTTPDLRVCDVNSMTFTIESLAVKAGEVLSAWRGNTTVFLSCRSTDCFRSMKQFFFCFAIACPVDLLCVKDGSEHGES